MLGSPWGIEDASCPSRPNPPVPTWHAHAKYRFQVGLGDDMIGYEKPAWSFWEDTQGSYANTDCQSDPHNHRHGLENEAVGPTMSNMVAQKLTNLLDAEPDLTSQIRLGRFVKADGSLTNAYSAPADHGTPGHFLGHAVAIWLAAPGSTTLNAQPGRPDSGTIVALPRIGSFGLRRVNSNGDFMDFDGADQPGGLPDIMTRGMLVKSRAGNVVRRYYVNVYPALTVTGQLGASRLPPAACRDHLAPRSRFIHDELEWSVGRLVLRGAASDRGCLGSIVQNWPTCTSRWRRRSAAGAAPSCGRTTVSRAREGAAIRAGSGCGAPRGGCSSATDSSCLGATSPWCGLWTARATASSRRCARTGCRSRSGDRRSRYRGGARASRWISTPSLTVVVTRHRWRA